MYETQQHFARSMRASALTTLRLTTVALGCVLIAACAGTLSFAGTGAQAAARHPFVPLTVVNQTPDTLSITLPDGGVASVLPHRSDTLGPFRPGPIKLVAEAPISGVRYGAKFRLVAKHPMIWTIKPRQTELKITNTIDIPVKVLVDGKPYGVVHADHTETLDHIPPGNRIIVAMGVDSAYARRTTTDLRPHTPFAWSLPPRIELGPNAPLGKALLVMYNDGNTALMLYADKQPAVRVGPGKIGKVTLAPGQHRIVTEVAGSKVRVTHEVAAVANRVIEWHYPGGETQVKLNP